MKCRYFLPLSLFLLLLPQASAQSGWFPYSLPWEDNAKTSMDASDLLVDFPGQDPATVVDSRGYLRAGADGHFFRENTGERARFRGVNSTFNANFPLSPDAVLRAGEFPGKRAAGKIARRLAKLGVNAVHFHHMDTQGSPGRKKRHTAERRIDPLHFDGGHSVSNELQMMRCERPGVLNQSAGEFGAERASGRNYGLAGVDFVGSRPVPLRSRL